MMRQAKKDRAFSGDLVHNGAYGETARTEINRRFSHEFIFGGDLSCLGSFPHAVRSRACLFPTSSETPPVFISRLGLTSLSGFFLPCLQRPIDSFSGYFKKSTESLACRNVKRAPDPSAALAVAGVRAPRLGVSGSDLCHAISYDQRPPSQAVTIRTRHSRSQRGRMRKASVIARHGQWVRGLMEGVWA